MGAAPARSRAALIVRVLGSAAGGGVPQWNCACANCRAARAGSQPRRSQSGFAISSDGMRWWLVNISPDIAAQIEATPALQPKRGRGTPIAGVLLTDANVDHLGGLAVTRQTGDHAFQIFSSATVRALAVRQQAFATFADAPHTWRTVAAHERFPLDGGLEARVIPIAGATPGYDGRRPAADAIVAFEIVDTSTNGRAIFAPVFPETDTALLDAASGADAGFYDGSFWSDDELGGVGVGKLARSLGHAPVGGRDGSLAALATAQRSGRKFFAHLNNTNPLLDASSAPFAEMTAAGFELALDGLELTV